MPLVVAGAGRLRFLAGCLLLLATLPAPAQLDPQTKQLSRDIFQQLIEINTTDSSGSTTIAANAMAKRLLDAGDPAQPEAGSASQAASAATEAPAEG